MAFAFLGWNPAVNIKRVPFERALQDIHIARVADTVIASLRFGVGPFSTKSIEAREEVWALRPMVIAKVANGELPIGTDPTVGAVAIARVRAGKRVAQELRKYYDAIAAGQVGGISWKSSAPTWAGGTSVGSEVPQVAAPMPTLSAGEDPFSLAPTAPASGVSPGAAQVLISAIAYMPAKDAARVLFLNANDPQVAKILLGLKATSATPHVHDRKWNVTKAIEKAVERVYVRGDVDCLGEDAARVDKDALPLALAPFVPGYVRKGYELCTKAKAGDAQSAAKLSAIMQCANAGSARCKVLCAILQRSLLLGTQVEAARAARR